MTEPYDYARGRLRWAAYWLLILTSTGAMTGRVLSVTAPDGRTPFLSANDRSRWCTIRSLVDAGAFEIDDVIVKDPAAVNFDRRFDKSWHSIDLVRHRGRDGREHYYSSKPTLLPILMAAPYWLLNRLAGVSVAENPFYVGRVTLLVVNVLPLLLSFLLFANLVERYGTTDWGRMFTVACATWGTYLTTYAVTLNNHLPAAISVLVAIYAALAVWRERDLAWYWFALAGFCSAFAAANELPALSLTAAVAVALAIRSPLRTALLFVPAAALVAVAFFGANYWAHESLIPPYAHRGKDGPRIAEIDGDFTSSLDKGAVPESLRDDLAQQTEIELGPDTIAIAKGDRRWTLWDEQGQHRLAVVQRVAALDVHAWDDWYDYEYSYWTDENKQGVDLGEASRLYYAFHTTLGHHGVVSLTPIWLLSLVGLVLMFTRRELKFRGYALLVLSLTLVVLAFYIARPLADRNYGGVTTGLRWMFWFAPLWLICLLPAADLASRHPLFRGTALLLLTLSVVSAMYGAANPWTHPWLFDYWVYCGLPVPGAGW
ncbi:MAG: hypothetical protein RIC55_25965 [Pirellulaceae bacterium]